MKNLNDILFNLQYTRMVRWLIFLGFDNFPNCYMNTLIFVKLAVIFLFFSTTFFNNVNIAFIESFFKLSFTSYNFVSFNKCKILCSLKILLFTMMPVFVTLLRKAFLFFLLSETHSYVFFGRIFVNLVFQSTSSGNCFLEFFSHKGGLIFSHNFLF